MTEAEYRALDAVNWSTLKHLRESPLAYQYRLATEQPDTTAFALGRATHCLVFEPDEFESRFVIWTGGRRVGQEWRDFQEQHEGATILKDDEADACAAMAEAVRRHPLVQPYLDGGAFEQSLLWTDESTGLRCKARPDWLLPERRILLDLKTCRSIAGHRFGAEAARYGYHMQLAHYRAGVEYALGWTPVRVLLVAVEKEPPHDVGVFELDEETLYAGACDVADLLQRLQACRDADAWPGRYAEEQALVMPAWVMADDNDEEPDGFGLVI